MTINYDRRGSGEPLVLIHGLGSRWQIWAPVMDALAERFDVIAVDLPGFGATPHPGTPITLESLVGAVEKLCSELGLERPHVAGNSMGGGIALELGKRGVARSVTAYSPIGFWRKAGRIWTQTALRTARALLRAIRPALPRLLQSRTGRAPLVLVFGKPSKLAPDAALADIEGLLDAPGFTEAADHFAGYRVEPGGALGEIPVTIAWGNRDYLLTYPTQAKRARRVLPHARHVTLRGSGHTPFSDDPQACVDVLFETAGR